MAKIHKRAALTELARTSLDLQSVVVGGIRQHPMGTSGTYWEVFDTSSSCELCTPDRLVGGKADLAA